MGSYSHAIAVEEDAKRLSAGLEFEDVALDFCSGMYGNGDLLCGNLNIDRKRFGPRRQCGT